MGRPVVASRLIRLLPSPCSQTKPSALTHNFGAQAHAEFVLCNEEDVANVLQVISAVRVAFVFPTEQPKRVIIAKSFLTGSLTNIRPLPMDSSLCACLNAAIIQALVSVDDACQAN